MRQDSEQASSNKFKASRTFQNFKSVSKLSFYETNTENFARNEKYTLDKIDPKGIRADGIYTSFSGVIEDLDMLTNADETLKISYEIIIGDEWHDQTPETDDIKGESNFCESKNGKVTFSLGFDLLVSCMYVISWPQIIIKVSSFNKSGELKTKGYAHFHLPNQTGIMKKQAHVYSIVKNEKWYHKWLPFCEPDVATFDGKEFERIIVKGEGRQNEKIRSVGVMNITAEALIRNYNRFGYE